MNNYRLSTLCRGGASRRWAFLSLLRWGFLSSFSCRY